MEQRTQDWLELRKTKITSSDAAPLLGVCPYKSPYQLYLEKKGIIDSKPQTEAMAYGERMEPLSLQYFINETKIDMSPEVIVKDWQMTSLDGFNPEKKVFLEIKNRYSSEAKHLEALDGRIPEADRPQFAHHFLSTDCPDGYFMSCYMTSKVIIFVPRETFKESYFNELNEKEYEFYERLQKNEPPEQTNRDFVIRDDQEIVEAADKWKHFKEQSDYYSAQEKLYRDNLISKCEGKSTEVSSIKISKLIKRGNIDYTIIPELKGVELEKYRKNTIDYWRIAG